MFQVGGLCTDFKIQVRVDKQASRRKLERADGDGNLPASEPSNTLMIVL